MANVVNKLWNMINMNTAEDEGYDDEEDIEENEYEDEVEEPRGFFGRKTNKVTSIQPQVKMVITQPTDFDEAEKICDLLREKKSIIINLEYVNKDIARRIIDVISGAVHVLDGEMQKISNSIFVVVPYNYELSSNIKEEAKGPVSWLKGNN